MTDVNGPVAAGWRVSSRCEAGHCVEVAATADGVAVRNNTVPAVQLRFDRDSWRGLLAEIRAGRLDPA